MKYVLQTVRQYWQLVIAFNLTTQCRCRGGGKWGHVPRGASTHLIQPFKNAVLSWNLDQNIPKNAYFWEKICKIAAVSGASPPNPRWPPAARGAALIPPHQSSYIVNSFFCICTQSTDSFGINQKILSSCNYSGNTLQAFSLEKIMLHFVCHGYGNCNHR